MNITFFIKTKLNSVTLKYSFEMFLFDFVANKCQYFFFQKIDFYFMFLFIAAAQNKTLESKSIYVFFFYYSVQIIYTYKNCASKLLEIIFCFENFMSFFAMILF